MRLQPLNQYRALSFSKFDRLRNCGDTVPDLLDQSKSFRDCYSLRRREGLNRLPNVLRGGATAGAASTPLNTGC